LYRFSFDSTIQNKGNYINMNPKIANILACPVCLHPLSLERVRHRLGQITSGNMVCENCSLEFPIVLGRPLLLPPGAPQIWMNAIDEAAGWRGETRKMPEVLVWLASVGVEEAMRRLGEKQEQTRCDFFHRTGHRIPAVPVSQGLLNQARYRKYGRWFQASGRISDGFRPRSWVLEYPKQPIPQNPNERDSVEEVVFQAIRLQPRRLLDVASGGGFCISRTLAHLPDFEFAIATERDLKATWIIQYKFKHIGVRFREIHRCSERLTECYVRAAILSSQGYAESPGFFLMVAPPCPRV
ncbi:MAG: Trm112 family protein, partial [Candidatus Poribacteria bacterium]